MPFLSKWLESCRILWVLSFLCIYLQKVPVDLFSFDWLISLKRITYFLFGQRYVPNHQVWIALFRFISSKETISRLIWNCIYMIPETNACKHQHHTTLICLLIFFFLILETEYFYKFFISRIFQLLCKMIPKFLFPLLLFSDMLYAYDLRQLAWLSLACHETLAPHHLNFSYWFCSFFHSGGVIFPWNYVLTFL